MSEQLNSGNKYVELLLAKGPLDKNDSLMIISSEEIFDKTLGSLLNSNNSVRTKYSGLKTLANLVRDETWGLREPKNLKIEIKDWQKSYYELMEKWSYRPMYGIFHEWEDIAELGIKVLKELYNEKALERYDEDPRFKDFYTQYGIRLTALRNRDEYQFLNEMGGY